MSFEQFQRTILLLGKDGLEQLRQTHVAIVGCGAVGGFAIEALARVGIGRLTLVDGDTVAESNINRQICATHQTLGLSKTEVFKKRIQDICPETTVITKPVFIDEENCADVLKEQPDFIIDAIDTVAGKIPLILYAQSRHIPIISSMGAALKTDWRQIKVAPLNQTRVCPLASRVRKLLREKGADLSFPCVFSTETPTGHQETGRQMGSLVTITGLFGLILASEVIQRVIRHV